MDINGHYWTQNCSRIVARVFLNPISPQKIDPLLGYQDGGILFMIIPYSNIFDEKPN